MNQNIAFIGCGNMTRSLIGGLIANGMDCKQLAAADPNLEQRRLITDQFGVQTDVDNRVISTDADVIVLAVKPQIMREVIHDLANLIQTKPILLISIAAGIRLASIRQWLNFDTAIVRIMPNTPALIQAGVAALFANTQTSDPQKNIAERMMHSVGATLWLDDEALMDSVTALSGSGPAYFFYMMELIEKTGTDLGLSKQQARQLTIETALGAAKMATSSELDLATLRKQVTSPGGTTEQALKVLSEGKFDRLIEKAMTAAMQRAIELSKKFGE